MEPDNTDIRRRVNCLNQFEARPDPGFKTWTTGRNLEVLEYGSLFGDISEEELLEHPLGAESGSLTDSARMARATPELGSLFLFGSLTRCQSEAWLFEKFSDYNSLLYRSRNSFRHLR